MAILLLAAGTALPAQQGGMRDGELPAVTEQARSSDVTPQPAATDAGEAIEGPEDPAAQVATLGDALKRAYWTNPNLLAQRAQLRGTDFRLPQARAAYGPRLDISGSYGYERYNSELLPGIYRSQTAWSATASAVISQPLYTFGRNSAAELGADAQITFSRNSLRATETKILLDTITAYAVLARDMAGVGIARDNLDLLQREYADTNVRFVARESTSTDFQQVETRVGLGVVQLYFAREQEATSRAEFLRVIGARPGDLASPNPLNLPVDTLDEAYEFAERNNPVLAAAHAREKVSRAAIASARAEMKPRIDLQGRAEAGNVQPYNSALQQTTLRGEVIVSAPIFRSGLLRARADEAREANQADWHMIDAALRDNRAEVSEAWNAMVARRAAIGQFRAAAAAAQQAYDGALLQERAGLRTTLDVLDLARELLTVRTGLNGAITDSYIAEARLLAAMGSLEGTYLLPDEGLYDPDMHYAKARNNSDVPLITPLIRSLDGIGHAAKPVDRPNRDPAAKLTTPGPNVETTGPLVDPLPLAKPTIAGQ